jgi:hypothetical protein
MLWECDQFVFWVYRTMNTKELGIAKTYALLEKVKSGWTADWFHESEKVNSSRNCTSKINCSRNNENGSRITLDIHGKLNRKLQNKTFMAPSDLPTTIYPYLFFICVTQAISSSSFNLTHLVTISFWYHLRFFLLCFLNADLCSCVVI